MKTVFYRAQTLIEIIDSRSRFKWMLFCSFLFFIIITLSFDTPWGDEAHGILMINESKTPGDLIHALGYEGSPWLWHALVYLISFITLDAFKASLFLHILIWTIIDFIVCYALELGFFTAAIILLSNPVWEYLINIRQYPLSILLIFLFTAIYLRKPDSTSLRLCLFLLAQTCVNGFLVSVGFFVFLLATNYKRLDFIARDLLLLAATSLITFLQLIPPGNMIVGTRSINLISNTAFATSLSRFLNSILMLGTPEGWLLICFLFVTIYLAVGKGGVFKASVLAFVVSCLGFWSIIILKYDAYARHVWLLTAMLASLLVINLNHYRPSFRALSLGRLLALVLLIFSLTASLDRSINFVFLPKTQAQNVASYVTASRPNCPILLYHETGNEVTLYDLGVDRQCFSLERKAYIKRVEWNSEIVDHARFRGVHYSTDISQAAPRLDSLPSTIVGQRPVLLLTAGYLKNTSLPNPFHFQSSHFEATLIHSFVAPGYESYLVYSITPPTPQPAN